MNDMFNLFNNKYLDLIAYAWSFLLGLLFLGCYIFYGKSEKLTKIGTAIISFSFVKRDKKILLYYALICFLVSLLGIFWPMHR